MKGKNGWGVVNTDTGKVHSSHSTEANARAQMRLLWGLEGGMEKKGKK